MKKTVTTLLVVATVFLCIPFNVFAVTGGGKTIVSNSYSYNNGDVTVYVRVNGQAAEELYEGQHYYPHNFTVTLANNTNEFQVADASNFSVDLYSGTATAFASNQNSWGAEVTSYSDNMTVPRITMYPSGDLAGHVIIGFNDSELLVLNPNETRTYNFSINFIQTENVNYTPLNGNFRFSYFTYTGNVGFYARPNSFSSNTIEDFINNDSLPNTAIAYYQYLIEQGIEDQDLLNNIINLLTYNSVPSFSVGTRYSSVLDNRYVTVRESMPYTYMNRSIYAPYIIDRSILSSPALDNVPLSSNIWVVPVEYFLTFRASNTYTSDQNYIINNLSSPFTYWDGFVGCSAEYEDNDNYTAFVQQAQKVVIYSKSSLPNEYYFTIPQGWSSYRFIIYYYFVTDSNSYFTPSINTNFTDNITNFNLTARPSSQLFSGITRNFYELINRLQLLLDTGNYGVNDDIKDQSSDNQSQEDIIHAQEQQWYQDNETAINAVGLSNYQFSGDQTSGLSGVTSQFTSVWNALDGWTNVYIFVLTLSLATFILRHKAKTKAIQKALD